MEDGAFGAQLMAALFFVVVGGRLLRLSQRTGEAPERLLGLYFAFTGLSYLGWVLPYVASLGSWLQVSDVGSWTVYCIGVVPYLVFIRIVFRNDARWAKGLVAVCVVALFVSTAVLASDGELYTGIENPLFWVQWLGYTLPCVWMTSESLLSHRIAVWVAVTQR